MVTRIDSALLRYAGWWIKAAAFFGIDRSWMCVVWAVAGAYIYTLPSAGTTQVIASAVVAMVYIHMFMRNYRDDDAISNSMFLMSAEFRLGNLLLTLVLSLVPALTHGVLMIVVKTLVPIGLIPWFLLNQSPKNPKTLRSWIRSVSQQIPKTAPVPIPSSAPPS